MTRQDTFVHARKIPLRQLRQRLFEKHLKYMRLTPSTTEITRSLCFWHDHATILKMGFILITIHVMYDPLVFFTDEEYRACNSGARVSIQAEVEMPEIYLLSAGSSSIEDQASLVGDRMSCLLDLRYPMQTESGIMVTDTV